jgi:hypothetical protein
MKIAVAIKTCIYVKKKKRMARIRIKIEFLFAEKILHIQELVKTNTLIVGMSCTNRETIENYSCNSHVYLLFM